VPSTSNWNIDTVAACGRRRRGERSANTQYRHCDTNDCEQNDLSASRRVFAPAATKPTSQGFLCESRTDTEWRVHTRANSTKGENGRVFFKLARLLNPASGFHLTCNATINIASDGKQGIFAQWRTLSWLCMKFRHFQDFNKRKTYDSLTWSNKMAFQRYNAPFQTQGIKSFLATAVFQSASAFTTQRGSPWTRKGVALQNFGSPAKKWKVDHKNVIQSKSKQLHFNVA